MKVAFTSTTGERIDQHFGTTRDFHVWEIDRESARPVGIVTALASSEDEEDRISARASAIAGCAIVYTTQIGGPAAAKLVARRIHPMKTGLEVPVAEAVARLQEVLRGNPPPWLRKVLGVTPPPSMAE